MMPTRSIIQPSTAFPDKIEKMVEAMSCIVVQQLTRFS